MIFSTLSLGNSSDRPIYTSLSKALKTHGYMTPSKDYRCVSKMEELFVLEFHLFTFSLFFQRINFLVNGNLCQDSLFWISLPSLPTPNEVLEGLKPLWHCTCSMFQSMLHARFVQPSSSVLVVGPFHSLSRHPKSSKTINTKLTV